RTALVVDRIEQRRGVGRRERGGFARNRVLEAPERVEQRVERRAVGVARACGVGRDGLRRMRIDGSGHDGVDHDGYQRRGLSSAISASATLRESIRYVPFSIAARISATLLESTGASPSLPALRRRRCTVSVNVTRSPVADAGASFAPCARVPARL